MEQHNILVLVLLVIFAISSLSVEALKEAPGQNSKLSAQSIAAITLSDIKASPKLEDICSKTENPRLCEKTVTMRGVDPKGMSAKTVLLEQMQACVDGAALAEKDCAAAMQDIGDKDKVLSECYKSCNDMYTKASGDLTQGIAACDAGDVDKALTMADNAMSYFESCDDAFEQAQVTSPLKETNDFLARLANNGINIARAMKMGGRKRK